jgi:hypothetical protein
MATLGFEDPTRKKPPPVLKDLTQVSGYIPAGSARAPVGTLPPPLHSMSPTAPENLAAYAPYQDQAPPTGGAGLGQQVPTAYASAEDVETNLNTLRFGQRPADVAVPQIAATQMPTAGRIDTRGIAAPTAGRINTAGTVAAAPGAIRAPQVAAAQGGFQDFDALQQSMYESQFNPVNRELERQRGMADERLAAQLAQAGIAESGTGVGQRAEQSDEYYRKQIAASEDAASRAAQQRYGMEYEQSMKNAQLRQEANLANAGFDMQAQVQNAQNLLQVNLTNAQLAAQLGTAQAQMETQASIAGAEQASQRAIQQGQLDTQAAIAGAELGQQRALAQADAYLKTMGLNFQQAQAAQRNYLDLLGVQQQDVQHADQHELDVLSLFYNTYLKQFAILVQAGEQSTGKTDSESGSESTHVQLFGG